MELLQFKPNDKSIHHWVGGLKANCHLFDTKAQIKPNPTCLVSTETSFPFKGKILILRAKKRKISLFLDFPIFFSFCQFLIQLYMNLLTLIVAILRYIVQIFTTN